MSQLLRSSLGVVCAACDGYNPPQSVRCGACNASLVGAPAVAEAPRPPAAAASRGTPGGAKAPVVRLGEAVPPGLRPASRSDSPSGGHAPVPLPPTPPAARPPAVTPRPAAPGTPAVATGPRFGLTVVAGKARGQRYRLPASGATLGQSRASILFAEDPSVSPHHATLLVRDGVLSIRDESSVSGVYVSVSGQESVPAGALFSAGTHLFRYTGPVPVPAPSPGRPVPFGAPVPSGQALYLVEEVLAGGRAGRALLTGGPLLTVGQVGCDLSYAHDDSLAPRHCELSPGPSSALLRDLSGGMGTFVRIPPQEERPLRVGDRVRIGQHVLQVEPPA